MKILAIGDFHGKFPEKLRKIARRKDIDFILCTGDLGGSKKLLNLIFKYFKEKWWKKIGKRKAKQLVLEDYRNGKGIINKLATINKKIYVINGNWDFTSTAPWERTAGLKLEKYTKLMKKKKNLIPVNRSFRKIKNINILFFGGMVTAGAYTGGALGKDKISKYKKQSDKETKHLMKYCKKNIDILFAHYPSYGYFDVVRYKGENPMNGKHIGFKGYAKFIKKIKPKLFICGHMHEYQGKKNLGKTIIVSTGSAQDGKAAIIEINENKKGKKKIKSIKFIR